MSESNAASFGVVRIDENGNRVVGIRGGSKEERRSFQKDRTVARDGRHDLSEEESKGFHDLVVLYCGSDDHFHWSDTGNVVAWIYKLTKPALAEFPIESKEFRKSIGFCIPRDDLRRIAIKAGLSWSDAKQESLFHLLQLARGAERDRRKMNANSETASQRKSSTINDRMLEMLLNDLEVCNWSVSKFTKALDCSRGGVHRTQTWKVIQSMREHGKQERATILRESGR